MQRFNPRVEKTTINIMLFLEKPLLFYTHQDYFYKNIEAFNEIAEYVNQQTGGRARWVDLEQVCNELYMERWGAHGGRDIRMIARSVSPINSTATSAHYHIKENLTGCQDLGELEIGTDAYTIEFEHLLGMQTALKPGEKMRIGFRCEQAPEEKGISVERTGLRNHLIRWLSDFRDRCLSTNWFGRKLIEIMRCRLFIILPFPIYKQRKNATFQLDCIRYGYWRF